MFRRMFVLRRVTATHVAALPAQPQMHPRVAHLQAFLATLGVRANVLDVAHVRTAFAHDVASCSCFGWLLEWNLGCCSGRRIRKRVSPGLDLTSIVPWCFCTMRIAVSRPNPVPSPTGLVVKNGSKMRDLISAGMPGPV